MKNRDEQRGELAFRQGKPFTTSENIDWQRGWSNAADDARLVD